MRDEDVLKVINKSGFPLQLGLVEHIKKTAGDHHSHVLHVEHAWEINNVNARSGFIDIIVEYEQSGYVFVIECKRVLGGTWTFLNPTLRSRHAKVWVARRSAGHFTQSAWADRNLAPSTAESLYCVVAREDKENPMLERIASELISATEAFAEEDKTRMARRNISSLTYASVIVTTAQLQTVTFDAAALDLSTGVVAEIKDREVVPYIRFRKQLSNDIPGWNRIGTVLQAEQLDHLNHARERTVFVINAAHFAGFLVEFMLDDDQD
jgi:hypothetical protein